MTELRRNIGFGLLTFYGIGVMVGAGIYVLVGAVAQAAGPLAPLAFLAAGLVAAPTALSYGELSARMPESAGEAAYARAATGREWAGLLTGLAIVAGGTISSAAILQGGIGYLLQIAALPVVPATVAVGLALALVAALGVVESLSFAALFTLIEITGLGLVVWVGFSAAPVAPGPVPEFTGFALAGTLAFFAFIGFEDMVNMAEETRDPGRTLPRAILTALAVTTALYALVTWAAVRAVPAEALGASRQPLALVWQTATGSSPAFLSAIAVFAALNGVLAQIIMASRVLYGLGRRTPALGPFARLSDRFQTPVRATLLIAALVVAGALVLDLATLAEATSILLLTIFCAMNAALIALKRRGGPRPEFRVPMGVPVLGLILAGAALTLSLLA